jgi:hypothetical protein
MVAATRLPAGSIRYSARSPSTHSPSAASTAWRGVSSRRTLATTGDPAAAGFPPPAGVRGRPPAAQMPTAATATASAATATTAGSSAVGASRAEATAMLPG